MLPYIEFGSYSIPAWALFWSMGILASQVYLQLQGKRLGFRWYTSLLAGALLLFTEMLGAKILYIKRQSHLCIRIILRFDVYFGIRIPDKLTDKIESSII